MRLDEFLDLHDRLVSDSSTALLNPEERRKKESFSPHGIERRNGKAGDPRALPVTLAGLKWIEENRRWEAARDSFQAQGIRIDDVLRAWGGSRNNPSALTGALVGRIVDLTSEGEAVAFLIEHVAALERLDPTLKSPHTPLLRAKSACRRVGVTWAVVQSVVGEDVRPGWAEKAKPVRGLLRGQKP